MARITGRIQILVNGNMLLNKAGAKAMGLGLSGLPNFELKEVMGDGGIHGYTEEPIVARCEVTITDRDDISINDLAAIREDGTVIFRSADSGKAYTMNNATCTRNLELTGGEGETTLVYVGANWIESTY